MYQVPVWEFLLPFVERSSGGIRMFQESDIEWLQVIGCMKKAGMSIKDIRNYIEMALQGDDTIDLRLSLFQHQREVPQEMDFAGVPERFRKIRQELRMMPKKA